MIKNKQTFSKSVKEEIVSSIFDPNCLKALVSSFVSNRLTYILTSNDFCWRLTSQFPFIIDFMEKAFKELYPDAKISKCINAKANNINGLTNYIDIHGNFDLMQNDLGLEKEKEKNKICSNRDCQRAYIAGAFLACGSVNSLNSKSYHLELRSDNYLYLVFLQNLLAAFNINAVLTKHSTKLYFLYIKKADQISDFLKLVNANSSMLKFEDNKISKDFNMQITRLNNLDISNLSKAASLGSKQISEIKDLKAKKLFDKQSKKFKIFCEIRLANPSISLNEITKIFKLKYKIKITKSAINHFGRKLNKLIEGE